MCVAVDDDDCHPCVDFDDDDPLAGLSLSDFDDDEDDDVKPTKPVLTSAVKKPTVKSQADNDESLSQGAFFLIFIYLNVISDLLLLKGSGRG